MSFGKSIWAMMRWWSGALSLLPETGGLMLVGEPGTAKTMLSELLSAAISGNSTNTIQGTAGTMEDMIKYSWNYALLLVKGPVREALVPSPLYVGMEQGILTRFEEITRTPAEIQDSLISVLSDKVLNVPELLKGRMVSPEEYRYEEELDCYGQWWMEEI